MLTVQIGQCGNQLGRAFFAKLAQEEDAAGGDAPSSGSAFFRCRERGLSGTPARRVARAVLVDMEPKVIAQCLRPQPRAWGYDASNTLTQQSGSGNNWALGYASHGARHEHALLELLRKEAERSDVVRAFLTLQSAAGGTGSGLGSFLTERVLADAFPSAVRVNAVVWPYAAGEVIVQNYNAVLTMACLSQACDGVLVLPNDTAHAVCQTQLRLARPSFDDLNGVLATQLAAAVLPAESNAEQAIRPIEELSRQLCAHPGYKLLDLKTIPQMPHRSKQFSSHTWTGVLKHLHQMQVANSPLEEGIDWHVRLDSEQGRAYNRSLGSMLLLRGRDAHDAARANDVAAFRDPAMYASWSMDPFTCFSSSSAFNAYDKSATLISNSKALLSTLASTVDKAYEMFSHGAYTHQYVRHGVDDAFFQEAFLRIDQIVQNYQNL